MDYLVVKWLHILSSTLLFGTGLGIAFFMLCTCLGRNVPATAAVTRLVVVADWIFTAPAVLMQPMTGFYLVHRGGFALESTWLVCSITLFVLAGACWLPVVWLQLRMKALAIEAAATGGELTAQFWRYLRIWTLLGIPAFVSLVAVLYLMVAKPA